MTPHLRKLLFETLYKNRYLYRFASTVPFAGQWRVWQRQVLPRIVGHDVLELGCGLGDLLADMLTAGWVRLRRSAARETLRRRGVGNEATVLLGSAQSLTFNDASFDTVVSTFPSEYIYNPDTIAEIARVLRPGGRLIVIEGANLLPVGLLQPFLMLVQILVYGPAAVFGPRKERNLNDEMARNRENQQQRRKSNILYNDSETGTGITTDVVQDAWFGQHIPLEQHGLRRRSERVRSPRWEIYITIGEKA